MILGDIVFNSWYKILAVSYFLMNISDKYFCDSSVNFVLIVPVIVRLRVGIKNVKNNCYKLIGLIRGIQKLRAVEASKNYSTPAVPSNDCLQS